MILSIDELGQVKLGDKVVPGLYQSMEVEGKLKVDGVKRSGKSGAGKLPEGWEDMKVRLVLSLVPDREDEAYPEDDLAALAGLFQGADKQAKPFVYSIVHPVLNAMNLREVLFSGLRVSDQQGTNTVQVELELEEFKPVAVAREGRAKTWLRKLLGKEGLGTAVNDAARQVKYAALDLKYASGQVTDLVGELNKGAQFYNTQPTSVAGAPTSSTFEADDDGPLGRLGIF